MRFFELKLHQNPFSAGLRPGSRWRSLRHSPVPIVGWEGTRLLRPLPIGAFGTSPPNIQSSIHPWPP